ncbi:hypothetical protein AWB68_08665 [Caballeronia choica]|uniref:Uncharacterized protein n=1 Tax=Caballeronia choica TaxID=326476 RepID=A0A158L4E3_9BURK|nr:hypothetical protein AWB68_08665 [Caballeronia choica]
MSRCSASPEQSVVRHEPQVPLSHELGARMPLSRKISRIERSFGISKVWPERSSFTRNGLFSATSD